MYFIGHRFKHYTLSMVLFPKTLKGIGNFLKDEEDKSEIK
jgi:hypothetical protein